MKLTREKISNNYFETLILASKLIHQIRRKKGYSNNLSPALLSELAQTAAGSEAIVHLIQTQPFNPKIYEPMLLETIDLCKKQLFPDINKRRFISISQTNLDISTEDAQDSESSTNIHFENTTSLILHRLKSNLSSSEYNYINRLLQKKAINISRLTSALNIHSEYVNVPDYKAIKHKIFFLKKLYPSGRIPDTTQLDPKRKLDEEQIINCYKNVYLGIDRSFPLYFLKKDAHSRAAILTKYLIEEILNINPKDVLEKEDETFFIRHKLQNIYRLFNYSANRVLGNAYPDLIHPWLSSRIPENYWDSQYNRIQAVKWLVEEKLKITPSKLYKQSISRKDFAENGLSYMFNQHYNAVSKALNEAYPELNLWEIGPVPVQYWHDKNAIKAIHWLIQKNRWQVTDLPKLVSQKKLNRKTFAKFGLATLFEKKFNKNIYQAINTAYPGQFEPWEFGKISTRYWKNHKNIHRASLWIASQEGVEPQNIPAAIREGRLNIQSLKKYSFGGALKKIAAGRLSYLFALSMWNEYAQHLGEQRIINKLQWLIRKEKQSRHFGFYILYGFFAPNMQLISDTYVSQYQRMIKRRKRLRDG